MPPALRHRLRESATAKWKGPPDGTATAVRGCGAPAVVLASRLCREEGRDPGFTLARTALSPMLRVSHEPPRRGPSVRANGLNPRPSMTGL